MKRVNILLNEGWVDEEQLIIRSSEDEIRPDSKTAMFTPHDMKLKATRKEVRVLMINSPSLFSDQIGFHE